MYGRTKFYLRRYVIKNPNAPVTASRDWREIAPEGFPVELELGPELEDVVVALGPVKKKVPAMGEPRPRASLNAVMLKFVLGVEELSIDGTLDAKSAD